MKSKIKAYQQELTKAREAYEKELKLYMLAQVASAAEKSAEKDQYSEYMCSECGDLYSRAGYKIVEVLLSGASSVSPPVIFKKEYLAVTQEPTGSSRILEKEIKPPRPTLVVTEQKPVPKSFKTACTETEPRCVTNAHTQTSSFQELRDTWKTEYDLSQGKAFQQ